MRIDLVAPHFHPDVGGVETHVLQLSEFLVRQGHEVTVHTSRRSQTEQLLPESGEVDGVRIRRYPNVIRLGYYLTLFRPRLEGSQLVHVHGYGLLANDWAVRWARRHGVPAVYSLHHGVARPSPGAFAALRRSAYDRLVGRRTLARAALLVAASEVDRRWLDARGHRGDRVAVVPTGLEESAFLPGSAARARERFGLSRYVLFLGRLEREKSVDTLVRALASLPERDAALALVGPDAGEAGALAQLADSLGVRDRVRILGVVDEETKRNLLSGCEVLVLPSFYEAQGIAILEAWAQSRPVVASRVGGVPDLVEEGRDGLLFDWGDVAGLSRQIDALLADPTRAAAFGAAGQVKARAGYRQADLLPRFLDLYDRVLTRARVPR